MDLIAKRYNGRFRKTSHKNGNHRVFDRARVIAKRYNRLIDCFARPHKKIETILFLVVLSDQKVLQNCYSDRFGRPKWLQNVSQIDQKSMKNGLGTEISSFYHFLSIFYRFGVDLGAIWGGFGVGLGTFRKLFLMIIELDLQSRFLDRFKTIPG